MLVKEQTGFAVLKSIKWSQEKIVVSLKSYLKKLSVLSKYINYFLNIKYFSRGTLTWCNNVILISSIIINIDSSQLCSHDLLISLVHSSYRKIFITLFFHRHLQTVNDRVNVQHSWLSRISHRSEYSKSVHPSYVLGKQTQTYFFSSICNIKGFAYSQRHHGAPCEYVCVCVCAQAGMCVALVEITESKRNLISCVLIFKNL